MVSRGLPFVNSKGLKGEQHDVKEANDDPRLAVNQRKTSEPLTFDSRDAQRVSSIYVKKNNHSIYDS